AMHGASEQCMQATEIERSPGTPSLIVTTRLRLTPHGTSCSCLHAVTQLLHSMQRSASQRNFIRAIVASSWASGELRDLAERRLRFLHHCHGIVAVGGRRVDRLAANNRMRPLGVELEH